MNKYFKFIYIIFIAILFVNYANGINLQAASQFGELKSYELSQVYSVDQMVKFTYSVLCNDLESSSPMCLSNLKNLSEFGGYSINQIANNALGIESVAEYNITYYTQGLNFGSSVTPPTIESKATTLVSGSIVMPQGIPSNKIKGVILFYHATVVNKNEAGPSSDSESDIEYASVYASQGYIVVLPDYIGYGVDPQDFHPYVLFPQVNVFSGVNMLSAARQLFTSLGISNKETLNLYITGYSEGGAYALWTSRMLQQGDISLKSANMNLKVTVPVNGAYDLIGEQLPFALANVSRSESKNEFNIQNTLKATLYKPFLTAYVFSAAANYNRLPCSSVMFADFCNLSNEHVPYTVPDLFGVNQPSDESVLMLLYSQATSMPPFSDTNNSIKAFVNPLSDLLIDEAESASLVSWKTFSPVTLVCLRRDSIVTNLNTMSAYDGMTSLSDKGLVDQIFVDNLQFTYGLLPIDHDNARIFTDIAALSVFNRYSKP